MSETLKNLPKEVDALSSSSAGEDHNNPDLQVNVCVTYCVLYRSTQNKNVLYLVQFIVIMIYDWSTLNILFECIFYQLSSFLVQSVCHVFYHFPGFRFASRRA